MDELLDMMPEWSHDWGRKRLSSLDELPSKNEVQDISDWLSWIENHKPKMINKLYKLTWNDAVIAYMKWSQHQAKKQGNVEGNANDVQDVLSCNHYTWKEITSLSGLRFEGNVMGHCIGQGGYDGDMKGNKIHFYSLRDQNNIPHVTVSYDSVTGKFTQVRGRANTIIHERYFDAFFALIDKINPDAICLRGLKDDKWNEAYILRMDGLNKPAIIMSFSPKSRWKTFDALFGLYTDEILLEKCHVYADDICVSQHKVAKNLILHGNVVTTGGFDWNLIEDVKYSSIYAERSLYLSKSLPTVGMKSMRFHEVNNMKTFRNYRNMTSLFFEHCDVEELENMDAKIIKLYANHDLHNISGTRGRNIFELEGCPHVKKIEGQICSDYIFISSGEKIQIPYLEAPYVKINLPYNDIGEINIKAKNLHIINSTIEQVPDSLLDFPDNIIFENCSDLKEFRPGPYLERCRIVNCGGVRYKRGHAPVLLQNHIEMLPITQINGHHIMDSLNVVQHPIFTSEMPENLNGIVVHGNIYIKDATLSCLSNIKADKITIESSTIQKISDIQCDELIIYNSKTTDINHIHTDGVKIQGGHHGNINVDTKRLNVINAYVDDIMWTDCLISLILTDVKSHNSVVMPSLDVPYVVSKNVQGHQNVFHNKNNEPDYIATVGI